MIRHALRLMGVVYRYHVLCTLMYTTCTYVLDVAPRACVVVNYVHAVLFLWVISINMISMLFKQSIDIAKQEPV